MANLQKLLNNLTLDEKFILLSGNKFFSTKKIKRLSIPSFRMTDGPFGVANHSSGLKKCTRFPATICLSSTWNKGLINKVGAAIGEETRACGRHMLLAPGINIDRTPLNGRTFEYFSEDPFLTKELAIPYIQGVQSHGIAACLKHYVANNQEIARKKIDVQVDERTLHEFYLRAFERVVKDAKPWGLMTSYNKINGFYASEHDYLLREVLIDKWGYEGVIISDWYATADCDTVKSFKAGLTLEMPKPHIYHTTKLTEAYENGEITEAEIDEKLRRLFRVFELTGVFGEKSFPSKGERNTAEHQKLSLKVAEEGIVLLKNERELLPLNLDEIKEIAVIGPNKNRKFGKLLYGGSSAVKPPYEVTPLKALKKRCEGKVKISNNPESADITIVFTGLDHNVQKGRFSIVTDDSLVKYGNDAEGADRRKLELPEEQELLIKDAVSKNKNTIVVLINGSPIAMSNWINSVPAVLEAWYGGMEAGNAIINVLFGDQTPSGKLPITFPAKLEDSPAHRSFNTYPGDLEELKVYYDEGVFVGYRYFDKNNIEPLFPFGFGLSYTNFALTDFNVSKDVVSGINDSLELNMVISNTGQLKGAEIIQVYASLAVTSVERAPKELVGFTKVFLNGGEEKTAKIEVNAQDLAYYDAEKHDWLLDSGEVQLLIGTSSRKIISEIPVKLNQDG
ncbi:MAG: beta-glucosidase family protein [Candidatus Hodarchaeales archaeon]